MKKLLGIILFAVSFILSGCGSPAKINLYVDEELYISYDSSRAKIIDLDIPEKDGMMFVGWEYDDQIVFDSLEVYDDTDLFAIWEDPIQVFDIVEHEDGPEYVIITGYNGDSIYMSIPAYVDGKLVLELGQLSFEGSKIETMRLPMDVKLKVTPFVDSSIRKVEYYGSYLASKEKRIGEEEYNEVLELYANVCSVSSGSEEEGTWTFTEGCPILAVNEVTETTIPNAVIATYLVEIDLNNFEEDNHVQFGINVFEGAYDLEEFTFPNGVHVFFSDMFYDCSNLTTFKVNEDNRYYSSEDGILYSKDGTDLRMYPPGLQDKEFRVPETVESIHITAFYSVTYLETLIIHSNYAGDLVLPGIRKFSWGSSRRR